MTNVGQTTFGEADEQELVTELVDEEEAISGAAISNQRSAISKTFTTEDTESTEKRKSGKTLPLINTDDTDGELPEMPKLPKIAERGKAKTLPRINAEERGLENISTENADEKGMEKKGVQKEIPKVIAMRAGGDD